MNDPNAKTITVEELYAESLKRPVDLIDVRSLAEFQEVRAVGARLMPIETFDPAAATSSRTTPADEPLYFICAAGGRSAWACGLMAAAGNSNVFNVVGGTYAWCEAGLPTETGA